MALDRVLSSYAIVRPLLVSVCALLVGGGCESESTAFVPGELKTYEDSAIGFSMLKPEAVEAKATGQTVTFSAQGFPLVTVTLSATDDKTGTGSSSKTRGSQYRHKVIVPMRELVCKSEDVGAFKDTIVQMCKSLTNTKDADRNPNVVFKGLEVEGTLAQNSSFKADLKSLKPQIQQCWSRVVDSDKSFPPGRINLNITFDSTGAYKSSSTIRQFYKLDDDSPLSTCVFDLVKTVTPTPDGTEIRLRWQIDFALN